MNEAESRLKGFGLSRLGAASLEEQKLETVSVAMASVLRGQGPSDDFIRHAASEFKHEKELTTRDHRALMRGESAALLGRPDIEATQGAIVCSFHYGPYMYVPKELAMFRGSLKIVITRDVEKEMRPHIVAMARQKGVDVEVLAAEEPRSMIRGLRSLSRGGTLMFYIDGNTGVGGVHGGRHNAGIDMLGARFHVKTGIAHLANKARVPIVVAIAYRSRRGKRVVECVGRVPFREENREEDRKAMTGAIYLTFRTSLTRFLSNFYGSNSNACFWLVSNLLQGEGHASVVLSLRCRMCVCLHSPDLGALISRELRA